MNPLTRQWIVAILGIASCIMAVIALFIVSGANEGESLKTALLWICGGIFCGGLGLTLTQVP